MPAKSYVQFKLKLDGGDLLIPREPMTIPADSFFFWPFNQSLGGARLIYATAQPICQSDDTYYFAQIPGVSAEFVFDPATLAKSDSAPSFFDNLTPGRHATFHLVTQTGRKVKVVLLSDTDSLAFRKITARKVTFDLPQRATEQSVKMEPVKAAGPAREIPLSEGKAHLALAPQESDFAQAAVWKITLPAKLDLAKNPLLRIQYFGDVARLTLNGRLLADNFYAGREFDLGLNRYGPEILTGDLRLEILPLRKDAPIFLEPKAQPDFGDQQDIVKLLSAEIVNFEKPDFAR